MAKSDAKAPERVYVIKWANGLFELAFDKWEPHPSRSVNEYRLVKPRARRAKKR